jgi:GNAT superfamily N-acetyltransferase
MCHFDLIAPKGFAQWARLYKLYLTAFPAAERKPFSMIVSMWKKGRTDIWCLRRNGCFAGLAITINGPDVILLDYLAVAEKCRSQGMGTAALRALREMYDGKGLFVEIESTREAAPNLPQRLRRKRFYLSCGMAEMHTMAKLFGVNMELLGYDCLLDYDQYKAFYRDNYNHWAAEHIEKTVEMD